MIKFLKINQKGSTLLYIIIAVVVVIISIGVTIYNFSNGLSFNKTVIPDSQPSAQQKQIMQKIGCNSESDCREACGHPNRNESECNKLF